MKQYIKELLKRKDLLIYLVASGLKAEHRNSYLGYFWWLLDPLLSVGIYYFVVVVIFRGGGPGYGPYLVVGMIVWRWVSTTISTSSKAIIAQAGIISQVYLPKAIFPICATTTQMVNFVFGLLVIAIFLIFFHVAPSLSLFWLPFVMLVNLLFLTALALTVSYISVFFRDFDNILDHLMRLWFFSSPVIWEGSRLPGQLRWVLTLNPMNHILYAYRGIILYDLEPAFGKLGLLGLLSIGIIFLLLYFYEQNEHKIIKIL